MGGRKERRGSIRKSTRIFAKEVGRDRNEKTRSRKGSRGKIDDGDGRTSRKVARKAKEVVDLAAAAAAASLSTKSDDDLMLSPVNDEPGTNATRKTQSVALQHLQNYKMTAEEHDSII